MFCCKFVLYVVFHHTSPVLHENFLPASQCSNSSPRLYITTSERPLHAHCISSATQDNNNNLCAHLVHVHCICSSGLVLSIFIISEVYYWYMILLAFSYHLIHLEWINFWMVVMLRDLLLFGDIEISWLLLLCSL